MTTPARTQAAVGDDSRAAILDTELLIVNLLV
jgi:hypothetical protein